MVAGLKPKTRHTSSPEPWSKVAEGLLWVTVAGGNREEKFLSILIIFILADAIDQINQYGPVFYTDLCLRWNEVHQ